MFNLAMINCEKQWDRGLDCKVTKAVVWANPDKPDTDNPNCSLDLDFAEYSMKELQEGILTGVETNTTCSNSTLTIDRNTKRVYLSFTRFDLRGQLHRHLRRASSHGGADELHQLAENTQEKPNVGAVLRFQ